MGPSSEALLRDAVVFYISSENRCARCYVPRINHDHRIHPQKKTRGQRGTNNNIIRSYEFLEMSFPPPPPKKPKKRRRRRRRCPNARRTEHGQVINNATPREGEEETERGSERSPTAEHGILLLPFEGFRCFSPLPLFSFLGQATPVKCTRRIPADTRCAARLGVRKRRVNTAGTFLGTNRNEVALGLERGCVTASDVCRAE